MARSSLETVATINGCEIERDRRGSCVWWHAITTTPDGWVVRSRSRRDFSYRRDAEAFARALPNPTACNMSTW